MAKTLTFSMAIDIQREEVLLPTDRRGMTTKTNVNRTNKPSTKTGHLQTSTKSGSPMRSDKHRKLTSKIRYSSGGIRMNASRIHTMEIDHVHSDLISTGAQIKALP